MSTRLAPATLALFLAALLSPACFFGGSDGGNGSGVLPRAGAVPTATLPANLPEPILLGQSSSSSTSTPGAGGGTYTVKSGDTLFAIAASLGIPSEQAGAWAAEVLRINGIADASRLSAGQELQLPQQPRATGTAGATAATPARTASAAPTGAQATATSAPAASATPAATATTRPAGTPTTAPSGGGGTYTVESGDYPILIAQKLGVPAAQQQAWANELVALNNINPNNMTVGQVLQLPAGTPGR